MVKARQRAPRKDPDQEAIVQVKDEINERMSKLIELLKDVKKGMNGGPAPEVGVPEKVNLTQPLPDSVTSAGNAAAQELSAITQGIAQVNQMQDEYAAKREQRLQERSKQMQELQQQVAEAAVEEEIRKIASNSLTRAWAHIVAPFSSEQGKMERLSLLRSLARLDDNLTKVEDQVLSGDPSILNALHVAKQLYLDAKTTFFDNFRKQLNGMVSSTSSEFKKLKDEVEEAKKKGLFDFVNEPLADGPVRMPGKPEIPAPPPVKREPKVDVVAKVDKAISDAETATQEVQARTEQVKTQEADLTTGPVQAPNIPDDIPDGIPPAPSPVVIPPPPVQPSIRQVPEFDFEDDESTQSFDFKEDESAPGEAKPESQEPEQLHEEVLNPPEDVPAVNHAEIINAVKNFIRNNAHNMYSIARTEFYQLPNFKDLPEPWAERFRSIWQSMTVPLQAIRTNLSVDKMITAYMHMIKGLGDFGANLYVLKTELKAAELKPDFVFGSTINEDQLQSQAMQFARTNWIELQKLIPNEGLVSEGSDKLTRWLKRIKTHLSFGPDKNLRLIVAKEIRDTRDRLQVMLNNLENRNINFRALIAQSDNFYDSFINMYDKLADLAESYNSRMMIEKSKRKYDKGRMRYDLIRETDIRHIRNIRDLLRQDKQSIVQLEDLENKFSELQSELEKARSQNG